MPITVYIDIPTFNELDETFPLIPVVFPMAVIRKSITLLFISSVAFG